MVPWCEWHVNYYTLQMVLTLPDETDEPPLTGGFAWAGLEHAWMVRDIGAEGQPSDEALTWLVQANNNGTWAFSPTDGLSEDLNATNFVEFNGALEGTDYNNCSLQLMNYTEVRDVEFCHWYIDDHQLHVMLPDEQGDFITEYVCPDCSESPVSILTQDVDFALLQRTY